MRLSPLKSPHPAQDDVIGGAAVRQCDGAAGPGHLDAEPYLLNRVAVVVMRRDALRRVVDARAGRCRESEVGVDDVRNRGMRCAPQRRGHGESRRRAGTVVETGGSVEGIEVEVEVGDGREVLDGTVLAGLLPAGADDLGDVVVGDSFTASLPPLPQPASPTRTTKTHPTRRTTPLTVGLLARFRKQNTSGTASTRSVRSPIIAGARTSVTTQMGSRCRRTRCTTTRSRSLRRSSNSSCRASFPGGRTCLSSVSRSMGTVHAMYRLGGDMAVRLPMIPREHSLDKELRWLPWLAPRLPLAIPEPLAEGQARSRVPVAMGDLPMDRRRDVGDAIASTTSARPQSISPSSCTRSSGSIPPTVLERTQARGDFAFLQRRTGAARDRVNTRDARHGRAHRSVGNGPRRARMGRASLVGCMETCSAGTS